MIIERFTLNQHDVVGDGVHIKAGGQFGQTFVFAAYDYQHDCSYMAIANPDGNICYSGSIPAAVNDTVLLDDGNERIVYLLSQLTQNEAGLWGVGALSHSSLTKASSCIFMVRFTFPSYFENTSEIYCTMEETRIGCI